MKKEILIILFLAIPCSLLLAFEQVISFGPNGIPWPEIVQKQVGTQQFHVRYHETDIPREIVLKDKTPEVTDSTDMLLTFDGGILADDAGKWLIHGEQRQLNEMIVKKGNASLQLNGIPVKLQPLRSELFSKNAEWTDFTISFWMYAVNTQEGAEIFNWSGVQKLNNSLIPQTLQCTVTNRKLRWEFHNIFQSPGRVPYRTVVEGNKRLLPRKWYHHTLHFNSSTGMLEYLIDGAPDAVQYVSETGQEDGTVFLPQIGGAVTGNIEMGRGFYGFLDNIRFTSDFEEAIDLGNFRDKPGYITTNPVDLEYSSSKLLRFDRKDRIPDNSAIFYYYRMAESFPELEKTEWIQFDPERNPEENVLGRYIQFMMELYPNGDRTISPGLGEFSFVYQPDLPPSPPLHLSAVAGNGKVHLSWTPVPEQDIKGYKIYMGNASRQYTGEGRVFQEPIDVGTNTSSTVTGLDNGTLYYFSVVSYDEAQIPNISQFSYEVNARPSRLLP